MKSVKWVIAALVSIAAIVTTYIALAVAVPEPDLGDPINIQPTHTPSASPTPSPSASPSDEVSPSNSQPTPTPKPAAPTTRRQVPKVTASPLETRIPQPAPRYDDDDDDDDDDYDDDDFDDDDDDDDD